MKARYALLLFALLAPTSRAQSVPASEVQVVQLSPSTEAQTTATLQQDLAPNLSACAVPNEKSFEVQIRVTVSPKGTPNKVTLIHGSGDTCVDQAAIETVQRSLFFPGTKKGKPIENSLILPITLTRHDRDEAPTNAFASSVIPARVVRAPQLEPGHCRSKSASQLNAVVALTVDKTGMPQAITVKVSSGEPCFDAAALRTASQYRFKPALRNSQPVDFPMNIEMQFNF